MYDYMYKASRDGKLEENEMKKWCKRSYSKFLNWFCYVLCYVRDDLRVKGKIREAHEKGLKLFNYRYFEVAP